MLFDKTCIFFWIIIFIFIIEVLLNFYQVRERRENEGWVLELFIII